MTAVLELLDSYEALVTPEYRVVIDDFVNADGEQMVLLHIDVEPEKFSVSVMKRMLNEWTLFRSCTDAPLYGIEPEPNDTKWENFVSLLGFRDTGASVNCSDGQSRRLFVSVPNISTPKDFPNEHEQHAKD